MSQHTVECPHTNCFMLVYRSHFLRSCRHTLIWACSYFAEVPRRRPSTRTSRVASTTWTTPWWLEEKQGRRRVGHLVSDLAAFYRHLRVSVSGLSGFTLVQIPGSHVIGLGFLASSDPETPGISGFGGQQSWLRAERVPSPREHRSEWRPAGRQGAPRRPRHRDGCDVVTPRLGLGSVMMPGSFILPSVGAGAEGL